MLGYVKYVFEDRVKIEFSKIVIVVNWKILINISEFWSLGFVFYYWWFIIFFVKIVKFL